MQADEMVHPPHHHWPHSGSFETFDMKSVRRGYEVYKQVCSACHSMDRISFRNLVDTIYPEEKCKEIAAEYEYVNKEPGDDGEMFNRPGKLFDCRFLVSPSTLFGCVLCILISLPAFNAQIFQHRMQMNKPLEQQMVEHTHQILVSSPRPAMVERIISSLYLLATAILQLA